MTRVRELRDLGDEELLDRLESSKEELFNLRFQLATGQLDNPMRIKDLRHDVARILTILGERDLDRELESLEAPAAAETPEDEGTAAEVEAPRGGFVRRRRQRRGQASAAAAEGEDADRAQTAEADEEES